MKLSQTSTRCRGRGLGVLIQGTKNQVAKWGPEGRSPHSHTRNAKSPGPFRRSPERPRVSLPPGKPARLGGHARPGRFSPPGAGSRKSGAGSREPRNDSRLPAPRLTLGRGASRRPRASRPSSRPRPFPPPHPARPRRPVRTFLML